jgi:hypothetical protein
MHTESDVALLSRAVVQEQLQTRERVIRGQKRVHEREREREREIRK